MTLRFALYFGVAVLGVFGYWFGFDRSMTTFINWRLRVRAETQRRIEDARDPLRRHTERLDDRPHVTDLHWTRYQMPCSVSLNVSTSSDDWLRGMIRGDSPLLHWPKTQTVIVQGTWEADRVLAAWVALKHKRGLPFGGAISQRAHR